MKAERSLPPGGDEWQPESPGRVDGVTETVRGDLSELARALGAIAGDVASPWPPLDTFSSGTAMQ
jgi:hypothetical protein